jgi:hypothetical protein
MAATGFCTSCGTALDPGDRFCGSCGTYVPGASLEGVPRRNATTSGKAMAALILGIGGFVFFPVVCSVLALVFGRQARDEIARDPRLEGAGAATAGIILGWTGLAVVGLGVLLFLGAVAAMTPG